VVRHQIPDAVADGTGRSTSNAGGMAGHDGYSLMAFAPAHLGNLIFPNRTYIRLSME